MLVPNNNNLFFFRKDKIFTHGDDMFSSWDKIPILKKNSSKEKNKDDQLINDSFIQNNRSFDDTLFKERRKKKKIYNVIKYNTYYTHNYDDTNSLIPIRRTNKKYKDKKQQEIDQENEEKEEKEEKEEHEIKEIQMENKKGKEKQKDKTKVMVETGNDQNMYYKQLSMNKYVTLNGYIYTGLVQRYIKRLKKYQKKKLYFNLIFTQEGIYNINKFHVIFKLNDKLFIFKPLNNIIVQVHK